MAEKLDVVSTGTIDLVHMARYGGVMRISGLARVWSGSWLPSKLKFAVAGEYGSRKRAPGGACLIGLLRLERGKIPAEKSVGYGLADQTAGG